MGVMYDNYWRKLDSNGFRKVKTNGLNVETINCDGYLKSSVDCNKDMIKIKFEKEEVEEKQLIEYLLKAAKRNVNELKYIDNMKPLDKLRNGVPIRLKTWLKGMFIIFQDNRLYTVLNNSILESNSVSMILSHDDNEWEEYDIPEEKESIIKEEDYIYFVNNIYDKLKRIELKEHEQSIVFAMKLILEKLI